MRRISMKHEYHCTIVFRYSTTRNRRSLLELFYAVWRRESCALQALRADTYRCITHTFPDGKLTKRFFFFLWKNKTGQCYSRSAYSLSRSLVALSWRCSISVSSASLSDRIWKRKQDAKYFYLTSNIKHTLNEKDNALLIDKKAKIMSDFPI